MDTSPTTRHASPVFHWTEGNRFKLLIDGEAFYPAMLEAIGQARRLVLLEMYLVESGHIADKFIRAFCEAAARGVQVYILLDDFGARGLKQPDRDRLLAAKVRLAFFNRLHYGRLRRNLFRDHRKLLVIDDHLAFVGGAGLTDEFDSRHPATARPWRETMIAIAGPVVADWRSLFAYTWRRYTHLDITLPAAAPVIAGGQRGRISYTRGLTYPEIKRSVVNQVRGARRRVWIATAYFVPAIKLRRALMRTARRGVDVRLLLPGPHTDHPAVRHAGRRFYHRLLRHGVRIFEYQPRFNHSKVVLCDDWVSIGSSNIDRWSLRWNLEANQEIDDAGFAAEVQAMLETDFSHSTETLLPHWQRRPWFRRLLERFWGAVDVALDRLFGERGKHPLD